MGADNYEEEVYACLTVVITDVPSAVVVDLFEETRRHNGTFEVHPPSNAKTGAVDVHCSFTSDADVRAFKSCILVLGS